MCSPWAKGSKISMSTPRGMDISELLNWAKNSDMVGLGTWKITGQLHCIVELQTQIVEHNDMIFHYMNALVAHLYHPCITTSQAWELFQRFENHEGFEVLNPLWKVFEQDSTEYVTTATLEALHTCHYHPSKACWVERFKSSNNTHYNITERNLLMAQILPLVL